MGDETALGPIVSNVMMWGEFGAVRENKGPFFVVVFGQGESRRCPELIWLGGTEAEQEEPHPELVFSADGGHAWLLSFLSYPLIHRSFFSLPHAPR